MICSRGDALSRLPLAIIFRAFGASIREHISRLGASIREHISRLGASIREHISRLRRFDSRTHFAPSALRFANTFRAFGASIREHIPRRWRSH
jgi:hypothetical protein